MTGLTDAERDEIDIALIDVYRAAWAVDRNFDATVLRAAYLQGRVDQSALYRGALKDGA